MSFRKNTISVLVGIMAIWLAAATPARGHNNIQPGQTIEDTLDDDEFSKEFEFRGHEDDFVTILLLDAEDDDDVDVTVELTGDDDIFASDSDERGAMIRAHRLRKDGDFTITVRRNRFFWGSNQEFKFVLSLASTGSTNDGGVIAYGQTVRADISPDGDVDAYRFHGRDGDHIKIRVTDIEDRGHFTPFVELIGPDGLIDSDDDEDVAEIEKKLDDDGDYTIVIWGGEPDWEGGPYELQLIGPGGVTPTPPPPPTPTPLPLPDLKIRQADVGPCAPTRLRPGDALGIGAVVDNSGVAAGSFWLEFWGSRTGGLTLDAFLTSSQQVPGLAELGTFPFDASRSLWDLPDGPYSVVIVADRPNAVGEWNEGNNRYVIPGKRILMLRPQANVDLVVQGFAMAPLPPQSGQPVNFTGTVRNAGTQNSGPFWIEFWQSPSGPYPQLGRLICDSIGVGDLAPGATVNLSGYPRTVYGGISTGGKFGIVVDRLDSVNETDETNNFQFLTTEPPAGIPPLEVTAADFAPSAPTELQPGNQATFSGDVINHKATASGPIWLEFWGSRTGGLTLDMFLADSLPVSDIAAGGTYHFNVNRPAYAVPDGPWTVVVTADRPSGGNYGRRSATGKRMLLMRPQTQANLRLAGFGLGTSILNRGQMVTPAGTVTNAGTEAAGAFWIEFWACHDQQYPFPERYVCDSIFVSGLAPGATLNLANYPRMIYSSLSPGSYAVGCVVDRDDRVNELAETDNYLFVGGAVVPN